MANVSSRQTIAPTISAGDNSPVTLNMGDMTGGDKAGCANIKNIALNLNFPWWWLVSLLVLLL
ncbi:hypothetical protein QUF63_06130 [Anaerolineales bacterium HSG25]|nr:hypothetical protein [Anaerolineales bacterium HSG25]